MACMNMLNNEQHHQGLYNSSNTMSSTPRISFSNDFADSQQPLKLEKSYTEAPVSSDFAFSVPNYSMNSADEIFFKGKIVPLREISCIKINTLRDELLAGDDDHEEELCPRLRKGPARWKERLGLRRSHVVPKKLSSCDNNKRIHDGSLESIDELKIQDIIDEDVNCANFKGFL